MDKINDEIAIAKMKTDIESASWKFDFDQIQFVLSNEIEDIAIYGRLPYLNSASLVSCSSYIESIKFNRIAVHNILYKKIKERFDM